MGHLKSSGRPESLECREFRRLRPVPAYSVRIHELGAIRHTYTIRNRTTYAGARPSLHHFGQPHKAERVARPEWSEAEGWAW